MSVFSNRSQKITALAKRNGLSKISKWAAIVVLLHKYIRGRQNKKDQNNSSAPVVVQAAVLSHNRWRKKAAVLSAGGEFPTES